MNAKRQLAYVPDDPRLFETLTVWEHLQFIASHFVPFSRRTGAPFRTRPSPRRAKAG